MGILKRLRRQSAWGRLGMALALACLLGAQVAGFSHRVAHGERWVQRVQSVDLASSWAHDDHHCQLFDALTLASFAGTAAMPVCIPPRTDALRVQSGVARSAFCEPLGFDTRAPPAAPRSVV
jgi:hypothetical protein